MHRCLQIPEIVRTIFLWLERDWSTLAALAVTCQAVHDPASDLLWSNLPSLAPLVRCFPCYLLEERVDETRDESGLQQQVFTKLVSSGL
jgi:hypothetical protein